MSCEIMAYEKALHDYYAVDDALFDQHVAVNLKGVFNGLREGVRRLVDGGASSASRPVSLGPTSRTTASTLPQRRRLKL